MAAIVQGVSKCGSVGPLTDMQKGHGSNPIEASLAISLSLLLPVLYDLTSTIEMLIRVN